MFRSFHKTCRRALGGLALLAAVGCQLPMFERPDAAKPEAKRPPVTKAEPMREHPGEVVPGTPADEPLAAADEATIAAVMDEVQMIGQKDPAAQQALLAELKRSKPSMWPLVVEQFRASLAYHEQLTAAAENRPASAPTVSTPAATSDRPSAELGQLPDPRRARPDPAIERLFATATPANMPPPLEPESTALAKNAPRAFADDLAAQPLSPRTAETATIDADVRPASYATSAPPTEPAPLNWQEYLDLAIKDLEERLADGPQSTAEVHQLVSLRLLRLLAGRTEESLEPIPNISPVEQDYWSGQIFALATFLDHHTQPDDKRRAAASVIHLDEAVGHLRELGSLSLRNLTFCKKVYDYGAYDPLERAKFGPGQQLLLYVEVENYHSESTAEGYCTSLGASYEILDEDGKRVDGGDFPDVEDCCRSRRRDFHIQYGLVLPKSIAAGKYRLEIAMKDRRSDKRGHASIAFEIRGQ